MKKSDTYIDKGLRISVKRKTEAAERMTPSEDFTDRLMQRIKHQDEKPVQHHMKFWPWIAAACVAASLVVFLIPHKGTEGEKKIVAKVEQKKEEKNIKPAIIAKKEPETNPVTPIKRKKREERNLITPTDAPQQMLAQEIHKTTPVETIKAETQAISRTTTLPIRTKDTQEMWYLATKNLDNPQLRDVYAIVWETDDFCATAEGTIYGISSLRPDLYTKSLETSKNTFRIDGRVGYDLTDSLYVVYMADTSEELDKLADDAFVAYMPVVNKRFNFSVEIDKPKVGRIRTVMPDGSLCHLWTNLDFVPGETYQITTHNGYYDEDRDYERQVGRYSGKSLLNKRQVRGIDDVAIVNDAEIISHSDWELSPVLKMQLEAIGPDMEGKIESVKALYRSLEALYRSPYAKDNVSWVGKGLIFDRITKKNKEIDATFHNMLKLLKASYVPADKKVELLGAGYTELMNFFTKQNKDLTEMMSSGIQLPKSARKTQKALNKYIEKYMTEMTKLFEYNPRKVVK